MSKIIEAIYQDGVFRPLKPIKGLKRNQKVSIALEPLKKRHPLAGLCGILPDKDAEEMLKIVKEEFEKVDINEW